MEEKNQFASFEELADELRKLVGTKRTFGSFVAEVMSDGSITVTGGDGWSITYPPLTGSWMVIAYWLAQWDETAEKSLESFVGIILYPLSMSLHIGDDEFIGAVADALSSLVGRASARVPEAGPVPREIVELFRSRMRNGNVS